MVKGGGGTHGPTYDPCAWLCCSLIAAAVAGAATAELRLHTTAHIPQCIPVFDGNPIVRLYYHTP